MLPRPAHPPDARTRLALTVFLTALLPGPGAVAAQAPTPAPPGVSAATPPGVPAPAGPVPDKTPAPPAPAPTGPSYHVSWDERTEVGRTETVRVSVRDSEHNSVGGLGAGSDGGSELHEIETVFRQRVTRVNADGLATELRLSVQSASGRASGEEPMRLLRTAHATLLVSLTPDVRVRRVGGGISAREADLWGRAFSPVDTDASPDHSSDFPDRVQVGGSYEMPPPHHGALGGGVSIDPNAKARLVVSGSKQVGGETYLLLNLSLDTAVNLGTLGGKDVKMTGGRMHLSADQTAPTKVGSPIRHEKMHLSMTMSGTVGSEGLTLPISATADSVQERTVLDGPARH